ncbi:leucyl aminopeptidase [Hydrogenophaga laconesensis]|uniref:Probable cytosol aminopeptidase n=1 Tax=Hydrogenophaga laconesensis TaxID=1805971 RepID=A0ABU1VFV2_9BURK|nr:leucyl aminopeptidase [Hydrogenophaga laconesensis]MDR7096073.1 leucyl aminopeptidase [Hydrogenophaga laconesensis]
MDFELKSLSPAQAAQLSADALLVLVPDDLTGQAAGGPLLQLVASASQQGDLESGLAKQLACYRPAGFKAVRVVLVRAGDGSAASVRKAVGAGIASLKLPGVKKLGLVLSLMSASSDAVRAAVQTCADATYTYTTTKPSAKARTLQQVVVGVTDAAVARAGFDIGTALVTGVEFAKEWANRPANHATPTMLGEAARKLGRKPGIKTEVLGPRQVEALGMGSFMAVARGSAEPLRFIVMHYSGAPKGSAPVVLVGKGITFDTGGISIKPAAEMDEMKFDMGGAASVLGTFAALAELKPAINVVGLIPSCENMPDGMAVKPGDVVTSMSGQTIEILNTDAEGRLILCDALTYAARFKPHSVIDIATLTGACVIALGGIRSGLFSTRDDLAQALQSAGETAQDLCWRMPLDDEYAEGLKSNFADMGNVAGRAGGAITAAKFLQKFTGELAWAHLDIAGTAWKSGAAKGSTGRPVPLLLQYLIDQAAAGATKARPTAKAGKSTRSRKA